MAPKLPSLAVPLLLVAGLWCTAPAALGCATRHFYNNSTGTFTLELSRGKCSTKGPNASKCTIPPGGVAELHFADRSLLGKDRVHVVGKVVVGYPGARHTTPIVTVDQTFSVESDLAACRIEHSGSTGNIVVNSDADGDLATCGPLYRTPLGRGDRHNAGYPCG